MAHPHSLQFGELFDKFKDMAFENHVFTVGVVHDLMWMHENNVEDGFPLLYCEECRQLMNFAIKILMTIRLMGDLRISRKQAYDHFKKNRNPLVDMDTFMNNKKWFDRMRRKYPAASRWRVIFNKPTGSIQGHHISQKENTICTVLYINRNVCLLYLSVWLLPLPFPLPRRTFPLPRRLVRRRGTRCFIFTSRKYKRDVNVSFVLRGCLSLRDLQSLLHLPTESNNNGLPQLHYRVI